MRVAGHNVLAIIVAAVVMYAIGALIYGFLFSELWMRLSNVTKDSFAGEEWRMALSPMMPVLIAIGMSVLIKWRGAVGLAAGVATGLMASLFFMFAARLYAFVYSAEPAGLLWIDTLHFVLICAAGGAVIGGWPVKKAAA